MHEQEALDLGPAYDRNKGRFHCQSPDLSQLPTVAWWARVREEERGQLSLFPVQAVTAPTGWETYQRFRELYRTPPRSEVLRRESYLAQMANCPPMPHPGPVSGEGSR